MNDASVPPVALPACPFCQSKQVSTTDKTTGPDAYWRCHACGQIWNPSRLTSFNQGWRQR
jgi:transposase-like protein